MYDEEELEQLRRRKLQELQAQQHAQIQEAIRQEEIRQEYELKKKMILKKILTPDARSRLTNLRMVKPQFAEQVELQLIQLAQTGRLQEQITDNQLKELLKKIQGTKKDIKIKRV